MLPKNKYIKGSSILEVLIALAIISFCLTLMVVIFLNIQKSTLPFMKIKANEIAEKCLNEAVDQRNFSSHEFKSEEFFVKKNSEPHPQFRDCLLLRVLVFDTEHKKLTELHRAVFYAM